MAKPRGDFIWYELMTTDADTAAEFYGAVLGWRIGAPDPQAGGQDYRMIVRDDGGRAGGVLALTQDMRDAGARPLWLPYLRVADVDAAVAAIEAEGGRLQMPAMDLPVGRIAMIADPQGVPIYVMDPIPPAGEPEGGSDVFSPDALQRAGWNELASPDLGASRAFYAKHFGFEFNEVTSVGDAGDYCFIDHGGRRLGAMRQRQSEAQPAAWRMYFRVPSIAKAKAALEKHGGRVIAGPTEAPDRTAATRNSTGMPGGDWFIVAADPLGAEFGLAGARD